MQGAVCDGVFCVDFDDDVACGSDEQKGVARHLNASNCVRVAKGDELTVGHIKVDDVDVQGAYGPGARDTIVNGQFVGLDESQASVSNPS